LKKKSPSTLVKSEDDLGEADVIRNYITRSDDESLVKINLYNELLTNIGIERNWGLVKNTNIKKSHFNYYGLHLNESGSAVLAKNIKHYVSNNMH
jgi:hypothetical protein